MEYICRTVRTFIFAVVTLTMPVVSYSASQWDLSKHSDGIKAYTKNVEGTSHLAFKGVAVMDGTVEDLLAIHRNVSSMPFWLHSCYEPSTIEDETPVSRIIHMKNSVPTIGKMLLKDRDLVVRQEVTEHTSQRVFIKLTGLPEKIPEKKGFVRVAKFDGHWSFTQISSTQVEVEYEGIIDPSGVVPSFMTNIFVVDTPYESLRKLRVYLAESKEGTR